MKRYLAIFGLVMLAGVFSIVGNQPKWGIGIIEIVNVKPEILSVRLLDGTGSVITNGSSLFLDDVRNNYILEIIVRDNNTVIDIKRLKVYIYSSNCTNKEAFDKQFCYQIVWNGSVVSNIVKNYTTVNLDNVTKKFIFNITFPKVARHYNSPRWNIEVVAEDLYTNDTKDLNNYFDFAYYVEYEVGNTTLYFPVTKLGTNVSAVEPLKLRVVAVNYDTKLYIWSNQTEIVPGWPISYVYVNGVSLPVNETNAIVVSTIPAGTENTNITVDWKVYVPLNTSPGKYTFYYFFKLDK